MAKRKAKRKKAKKTAIVIRRVGPLSWEITVQASEAEVIDWIMPPVLIGRGYYINRDAVEADAARWSKVLHLPVVTEEK